MKKSEMVKKIEACLVELGIFSAEDISKWWRHDAAKTLLKAVEKAGMLPPSTHIPHKKSNGKFNCLCGHGEWCEYCSPFGVDRNEWEK